MLFPFSPMSLSLPPSSSLYVSPSLPLFLSTSLFLYLPDSFSLYPSRPIIMSTSLTLPLCPSITSSSVHYTSPPPISLPLFFSFSNYLSLSFPLSLPSSHHSFLLTLCLPFITPTSIPSYPPPHHHLILSIHRFHHHTGTTY